MHTPTPYYLKGKGKGCRKEVTLHPGTPALLFYYFLQFYGRVEDGELPGATTSSPGILSCSRPAPWSCSEALKIL